MNTLPVILYSRMANGGLNCGHVPLYELLVLVDAIRGGRQRERALAIAELDKRWGA